MEINETGGGQLEKFNFPCPNCGSKMESDIHSPLDGARWKNGISPKEISYERLRGWDNWICTNEECFLVLDRDDDYIKKMLKEWADKHENKKT